MLNNCTFLFSIESVISWFHKCLITFIILSLPFTIVAQQIHEIQGRTHTSPFLNKKVSTQGVVTYLSSDSAGYGGFFIQSPTPDEYSETSEGIFVFTKGSNIQVQVGNYIEITATVTEYFGLTELVKIEQYKVIEPFINIAPVLVKHKELNGDLEHLESMLVAFADTFTVCDNHNLGKYGQLTLSSKGRLVQATELIDPNDSDTFGNSYEGMSNIEKIKAQQELINKYSILIDDGLTKMYSAFLPFIDTVHQTIRNASKMYNVQGIVNFSFGTFTILPSQKPNIEYAQRPASISISSNHTSICSVNLQNYFVTLRKRGADSKREYTRQSIKIIKALQKIPADILAIIEVENHPNDKALLTLKDSLNNHSIINYTSINIPAQELGSDEIKSAILYNASKLTPLGKPSTLQSDVFNRSPIAQSFCNKMDGSIFLVLVVHLKSKRCDDALGQDSDQGDGQSCYNQLRKKQVKELANYAQSMADSMQVADIIIVGDFNAYSQEDPMDLLRSYGFVSVFQDTYSYVYDGMIGSLDHAMVSQSLYNKINQATKWHINADEPTVIDYNTENRTEFNDWFQENEYRFSDHDPVIVQWDTNKNKLYDKAASIRFIKVTSLHHTAELTVISPIDEPCELIIYNQLGQVIKKIATSTNKTNTVNISSSVGTYHFCALLSNSKTTIQTKVLIGGIK